MPLHVLEPFVSGNFQTAVWAHLWHVILVFNWKSLADIRLINFELLHMVILRWGWHMCMWLLTILLSGCPINPTDTRRFQLWRHCSRGRFFFFFAMMLYTWQFYCSLHAAACAFGPGAPLLWYWWCGIHVCASEQSIDNNTLQVFSRGGLRRRCTILCFQ